MAKLVMLRGNSGSGKTTVAGLLQRKFGHNTLVISQDAVRREMLWVKDGPDNRALPLLQTLLLYGKERCEVVVLEGILHSGWYQPLFELAKEAFGEEIYAYYYDLSFEETMLRHRTRDKRDEFGEEAMRRWWLEKEDLDLIREKIFTAEISAEEAAEQIFQEVQNGKE